MPHAATNAPPRRLLLLDTSGRGGLVAVAEEKTVRAVRHLDEARFHARDLAPAVQALLQELAWPPASLYAVVVGRGPGSYTGLRVGLMAAKTLAYATRCRLVALDSFAVLAAQAPGDAPTVDVIADAQQRKVYWQRFGRAPRLAPPPALTPLAIAGLDEWLAGMPAGSLVTGPGLAPFRAALPAGVATADEPLWRPSVDALLALGLARLDAGESDDVHAVEPLYLRPSSAEEKWDARPGK